MIKVKATIADQTIRVKLTPDTVTVTPAGPSVKITGTDLVGPRGPEGPEGPVGPAADFQTALDTHIDSHDPHPVWEGDFHNLVVIYENHLI